MKFENSTVKVFGAFALVILVVLGFIILDNWHGKEASGPEGVSEPQPVAVQENGGGETAQPTAQDAAAAAPQQDGGKGSAPRVIGSERSVRLSKLLDNDAAHADALALALELAEKGNNNEKVDALSALEWLGGKEAVLTSIKLKGAGDAVGERAGQVLNHLIQESLVTGEPLMDAASWKALFNGLYDDSEIQSYMVLLSGYSLEDSFPILLELAESGREKVADVAKEYLSSVAFGREFKDVED
ncbi:MAG: hypothetical protein IKZ84_04430, partial [Victivallales bacterium]|nr:hypothetical protein [Victivallales bacterium]